MTLAEVAYRQRAYAATYRGVRGNASDWQTGRAQGTEEATKEFEADSDFKLRQRIEEAIAEAEAYTPEGIVATSRLRVALNGSPGPNHKHTFVSDFGSLARCRCGGLMEGP